MPSRSGFSSNHAAATGLCMPLGTSMRMFHAQGLTPWLPRWLSQAHAAPLHHLERPTVRALRRVGCVASRARTYYLASRCGTRLRVGNRHTRLRSDPAPATARGFAFQGSPKVSNDMNDITATSATSPCAQPRMSACGCLRTVIARPRLAQPASARTAG
ncbi:hypothetical protein XACM_3342 [Xanthomonas euvesicatoria pv. citrumelo F1]|nr:hypothetical protein XACM_3342 [Xanthomonas euvesicatoria pv. citrumelo F1]